MPACQSRQDATGIKLKKKVTFGSTTTITEYMDTSALLSTSGFQYKNTALDFFPTAEGYVKVLAFGGGTSYNYVFNYTDHSCLRRGLITDEGGTTERVMAGREEGINIRAKYTQDPNDGMVTLIEENQYYPSCLRRGRPDREEGIKHLSYNRDHSVFEVGVGGTVIITPVTPLLGDSYTYKFGGKEQQTEFNINTYDFGARNYDPALGRWMNVDPLAEYAFTHSPYHYTFNNPIYYIDPDGMMGIPMAVTSLGMGIDGVKDIGGGFGGSVLGGSTEPDPPYPNTSGVQELPEVNLGVVKKKEENDEGRPTVYGLGTQDLGEKEGKRKGSIDMREFPMSTSGGVKANRLMQLMRDFLEMLNWYNDVPEGDKKSKSNKSTMETNNEEPVEPPSVKMEEPVTVRHWITTKSGKPKAFVTTKFNSRSAAQSVVSHYKEKGTTVNDIKLDSLTID